MSRSTNAGQVLGVSEMMGHCQDGAKVTKVTQTNGVKEYCYRGGRRFGFNTMFATVIDNLEVFGILIASYMPAT